MNAIYKCCIVIFLIYAIGILNYYSDHWDKPTRAKYGIYITILRIFNLPLSLYILYYLFRREKPYAVPANVGGESGFVVRNKQFDPLETLRWKHVKTLDILLEIKFWDYKDRLFLGTREVISREVKMGHDETSSEKIHLGNYKWLTYDQASCAIFDFSNGLGLLEIQNERAAIFSDNRAECFIALHACFKRGVTVVILDASLGEEALRHSLNEAEVKTVICGHKELNKLVTICEKLESAKRLICMDKDIPSEVISALHGWTIISFADVTKLGSKTELEEHYCHPEEVAIILYTSESTGLPKGVMMTHANILATTAALTTIIPNLRRNDVYLACLPMANVLELVVEQVIAAAGGAIGYGSPWTLTDTSNKIVKGTKGDAAVLMPTLMAAVPSILEHVHDGALKQVNAMGELSQKLFSFAYKRRLQAINGSWFGAWGLEKVLWNFIMFRKVQAIMGGRMRFILSSGAPLSANTQRVINICLSAILCQGYGLIETCANGTFSDFDDTTVGRVGLPLPHAYIKLIDWPEGGYSINDSPMPRGEVVIGGTSVTLGYLKNEEKTRESYEVDEKGIRWFYTGDIGRFHADGCLEIIGGKEDIVKLQHEEYDSLGKVEEPLLAIPCMDNIMLHNCATRKEL